MNVVAICKGEQRFVFIFDDESLPEALKTVGKYAADPEMPFSWYDAAIVSQRMRNLVK
jgi:hypothetical protein